MLRLRQANRRSVTIIAPSVCVLSGIAAAWQPHTKGPSVPAPTPVCAIRFCALVSTIAHYLGVRLVLAGILFGAIWAAGALFVTPKGRKAIHFFWDSIVGYTPRG